MVTRRSSDVDLQSRAGMRGLHSSKSIISSFPREKAETRNEWRFDLSPKAIGAGGIFPYRLRKIIVYLSLNPSPVHAILVFRD